MTMYGKISLRLLFAAMLATALMLAGTAAPALAATKAHGTVRCMSGAKVVGIWINAKNGGSNFAEFKPINGNPSVVSFHRTLPRGGKYDVTVGCGGTSKHWKTSIKSTHSMDSNKGSHRWNCHDYTTQIPKFCTTLF